MLDQPSNMHFDWNDANIHTLRRLWGEGKSASEIAAALPGDVSRSAVIGKANRLKLSRRAKVTPSETARVQKKRAGPKLETPPFETTPLPEEELGNDVTRFTLLEASDNKGCMYCTGDPLTASHSFCNQPRKSGTPWCDHHYGIVYKAVPA